MNPFFIFLVLLGAVILWFLLAFLYEPVGTLIKRLFDDSMKAISEESEEKENEQ